MSKNFVLALVAVVAIGGLAYWGMQKSKLAAVRSITTFEQCVEAGYTVVEGAPRRCLTPDGRSLQEGAASAARMMPLTDGAYAVDAARTQVYWEGTKPLLSNYVDRGTIVLSASSSVTVAEGNVSAATLVFDMNSITAESTGSGGGMDGLTGHLKKDDFFGVAKYPTATFVLSSVVATTTEGMYDVTGTLSIKDKTLPVVIPARLSMDGDALVISGEAVVDRTAFGITYGSGTFFKEMGDKAIGDTFKLIFTVVGAKR